jgi:hypothetical protein
MIIANYRIFSIANNWRWDGEDGTDMDQNRDYWRVLVSTVMNLGFHKMLGSS